MKIQKYKWVGLGLIILLILGLIYKNKEGFVQQSDKYVYSTTTYNSANYKSNNIITISDINSEDCFKLCILDRNCTGYVMDNKSSCHLKKGDITEKKLSKDSSKTTIINKIKKNLNFKKNKNVDGEPIKEYNEKSYTQCYKYCIAHDCAGFVTDFEQGDGPGKCKLYSDISDNIFKENDSYITLLN